MSRGWAKASACCLQTTLSCAFLCHIVSLQYLSRSSLHRLAGLPCRLFLSYGLQLVTREVHRSSLRRLICPAQDHFIFLTVLNRACDRESREDRGRGKGGTILVHVGTNNTDKEGTTAIVEKYRKLLKKTKQARLGQIILSGILPVCGNRIQGYRNSKRMAVNGMVERLCQEEDVGYVDMWDSFVGKEELYFRDGLHLSGKGAAVLAEGLSGAVASGLGKVRYLN